MINYSSKASLIQLLSDNNIAMSKSRGQNFLIDGNIRNMICNLYPIEKDDIIWEIGPGVGQLSSILCEKTNNLTLFELDNGFIKILRQNINANIVEGDFLKTFKTQTQKPKIIFGNLPYNISSRIIVDLIEAGHQNMVFVIQKEMAQRIVSKPNSKNYSIISILAQIKTNIKIIKDIPSESFYPKPKVISSVVVFSPNEKYNVDNYDAFKNIAKLALSSRRKVMISNLAKEYDKDILKEIFAKLSLRLDLRGEDLDIDGYINIANLLNNHI